MGSKYCAIINNFPEAVIIVDNNGNLLNVSKRTVSMFGYETESELSGRQLTDIIVEADRERIASEIALPANGKHQGLSEYYAMHKNGTVFAIEINVALFKQPEETTPLLIITIRDITRRKLSEARFRALSQAVEQSPASIVMTDIKGNIEYVNKKFIEITGYSYKEIIGQNPRILKTDYLPSSHYKRMWQALLSGNEWHGELHNKKKNGELYWENAIIAPIVDDYGNILSFLGIKEDITERKHSEMLLKESEEQHRLLFETAQEAIIVIVEGRLHFFNPSMTELTGYESTELMLMNIVDLIHPDDVNLVMNNYKKRLAGEKIIPGYHFRMIRKDKSVKWVGINGAKIQWKDQPATLNFLADITEQVNSQTRLKELNENLQLSKDLIEKNLVQKSLLVDELSQTKEKLEKVITEKDKFFSIIAHDLKSPFQGFMGLTELMSEDIESFSREELSVLSKEMNDNAKNLFKLLGNMLDWARMQQGAAAFNPKKILVSKIISQNINLIAKRGEQKGITLISEVPEGQAVYADEDMLNSVIRNLLSNAVKFTKRGGKVLVSSRELENGIIEVSVADSGIGMPPDILDKLFRIQEKTSRYGTDGETSTGLGLLLSKEYIDNHNGKIWAESRENDGSTFYFTLPSADTRD